MTQQIVDKLAVRPNELKPGDVMVAIITCHIQIKDNQGALGVNCYVCPWPPQPWWGEIPQGNSMNSLQSTTVARMIFPVTSWAGALNWIMEDGMLPCPCCGEYPEFLEGDDQESIRCWNCGLNTGWQNSGTAKEHWNRRA